MELLSRLRTKHGIVTPSIRGTGRASDWGSISRGTGRIGGIQMVDLERGMKYSRHYRMI